MSEQKLPTRLEYDGKTRELPPIRERIVEVWGEKKSWFGRTRYIQLNKKTELEYYFNGEWQKIPSDYTSLDAKGLTK